MLSRQHRVFLFLMEINGYQLTRSWFDFCFANPEKITPSHTAIFVFAIEHCNRLGWKEKFGFPSQMTMDALGIKKHQTYIKYFNDLVDWGFFKLVQKSNNQYSANIISLSIGKAKNGKALDKAFITYAAKQTETNGQSTGQSKDSIDKQQTINQLTTNKEQQDSVFDLISNPSGLYIVVKDSTKIPIKIHQQSFNKWLEGTFGPAYEGQKFSIRATPPIEEFFKQRNGDIYDSNNHVWNAFKKLWIAQPAAKISRLQQ